MSRIAAKLIRKGRVRVLKESGYINGLLTFICNSFKACSAAGPEIVTARGGDEALRTLANRSDFSLVVTDFAVVGMDGVDFLTDVKGLHLGLPGLVISGFATQAKSGAALIGIDCLENPIRLAQMIHKISSLIQPRMHASAESSVALVS
jgi:DNA-binding NtrC family response regulator